MQENGDKVTVLFMLALLALVVILVEERWVRVGLGLLPALLLAQRALLGKGVGAKGPPRSSGERRVDHMMRGQIEELLELIRDFYTLCHLVAGGDVDPEKAKAKAHVVERRLNAMLGELLEPTEAGEAEEAAEPA